MKTIPSKFCILNVRLAELFTREVSDFFNK